LAQGTAAEIIAGQNLSSWVIHGDRLIELQDQLRGQPGVEQTVIFGDGLHVSGADAAALERSVQSAVAQRGLRAEKIETGLEDVFIYMMSRSADNFGGGS
jgi:ABC-2 type transport system ATP-binding protein